MSQKVKIKQVLMDFFLLEEPSFQRVLTVEEEDADLLAEAINDVLNEK